MWRNEAFFQKLLAFERVGAVGPKLLYPNGRLQDAGSMLEPDLSVTMVGGNEATRCSCGALLRKSMTGSFEYLDS